jgi:hypothetical protein
MEQLPFLENYRQYFLVHHFRIWMLIYSEPIPWERMAESLCMLIGFILTTLLIGMAGFQARDIKS